MNQTGFPKATKQIPAIYRAISGTVSGTIASTTKGTERMCGIVRGVGIRHDADTADFETSTSRLFQAVTTLSSHCGTRHETFATIWRKILEQGHVVGKTIVDFRVGQLFHGLQAVWCKETRTISNKTNTTTNVIHHCPSTAQQTPSDLNVMRKHTQASTTPRTIVCARTFCHFSYPDSVLS
jgi:hypothetical protein